MSFVVSPLMGIVVNGGILYVVTQVVEEIQYTGGFKFFLIGGIVLGLINFFMKPIIKAISLPFVIITGGLFLIVINVFVLWFLSYFIGIIEFRDVTLTFPDWSTYVIGAIVFGIINWVTQLIVK